MPIYRQKLTASQKEERLKNTILFLASKDIDKSEARTKLQAGGYSLAQINAAVTDLKTKGFLEEI